jgi:superfamily I DNA and/or RNA helicase
MNSTEYFDELLHLNNYERQEEMSQFNVLMQDWSVGKRVEAGICWHPLNIVETGYGFGDYPFTIVERTKRKEINHFFGSGKPVLLFSAEENAPEPIKAVVQFVSGDQMKLVFFFDDEPEILSYSKLGVVVMPDENAYREQERAIRLVANAKNCRLAELREALILNHNTRISSDFQLNISSLNQSQSNAINLALNSSDVALIHGPPGTGKTTSVVALTKELVAMEEKVMLTAASNTAVDLLALKASEAGLRVLRIGNPARMDESIEAMTPEGIVMKHPNYTDIKKYRKEAAELRRMASKYKRNFGKAEREQRRLILLEAKNRVKEAIQLENYLFDLAVQKAEVICCTLIGSTNSLIRNIEFDTVIIDEAAQAPEPATWVPISKAGKVVFAGDPFQLPPVIKSDAAIKGGLMISLMEKLLDKAPTALLNTQYRMKPVIMEFPNRFFYKSQLMAHESLCNPGDLSDALLFIDTAGKAWDEELNNETKSYTNSAEALFIAEFYRFLITHWGLKELKTGIISPYQQQVKLLQEIFMNNSSDYSDNFPEIQTIDSFQGQERDAIIVSLVRSNQRNEIGFLKDYRRMNVAMTRAKKKLLLIGDSSTLATDRFYSEFINYAQEIGCYKSVWEFEGKLFK